MKDRISNLARRARREYSNKGLRSFIANGFRFVARDFWLEEVIERRSISRSELQSIAEKDENIWYAQKEGSINIDPAPNHQIREEFKPYPSEFAPETPFVCELSDCYLLGDYAVGMTEEGSIISETAPVYKSTGSVKKLGIGMGEVLRSSVPMRRTEPEYDYENVFPLVTPYASYYHWMVEYLPKLRLLEHYIEKTGKEPTVLVESDPRGFVRGTLETIGYPSSSYEEWRGGKARIDSLILTPHRIHSFNYRNPPLSNYNPSRDDIRWLRQRVRSSTNRDRGGDVRKEKSKSRRIYISRQEVDSDHTSSRKVLNYDEVKGVLDEFGFEPYIMENLPFRRQAELFADADVVMGPHGAGLVNIIFSDNPLVVELFPESKVKPHFYFISDMMGFGYEGIVTDAKGTELVVDTDLLRSRLESVT